MIYPNISLEEWLEKHPIEPVEGKCYCGRIHRTTKPVILKDYIGLVANKCDCGVKIPVSTYIDKKESIRYERKVFLTGANSTNYSLKQHST